MTARWEFFDHTADLGVRVTADSLPELIRAAGEGLYEVIGQLETHRETHDRPLEFAGDDPAVLLRDYLAELLLYFERDQLVATEVVVAEANEGHIRATARMAAVDPQRSTYHREVKAVTYHQLTLERTENGYEATFIVDI